MAIKGNNAGRPTLAELDALESRALAALVKQAREGNTGAAKSALVEADRIRRTRLGEMHRAQMAVLAGQPVTMCGYLASLGVDLAGVELQLGRPLTGEELAAWRVGQSERLLEVRAIEVGRMRRGAGTIPKWATRRHDG